MTIKEKNQFLDTLDTSYIEDEMCTTFILSHTLEEDEEILKQKLEEFIQELPDSCYSHVPKESVDIFVNMIHNFLNKR